MQNKDLKKIENKGWKQMQLMLDQELPVEKSKRRFVPWFWFSSVAAVLVLGAAMFFMNQNTDLQNNKHLAADKVATVPSKSVTKINKEEISETAAEKEFSDTAIASQKEETRNKSALTKKEEVVNIEIINPVTTSKKIILNQNIPNSIDQKIINQYENFMSENLSTTFPQPSVLPTVKTSKTFINIEELPSKYADLVYNFSKKLTIEPITFKTIKPLKEKKSKEQWAINVGVLSNTQPRLHGGSTGIQVQFPLSKKWSLKTGLSYRFVKLQKIFVSRWAAQRSNDLDDQNNNGPGLTNLDSLGFSSTISIEDINRSTYNNQTKNFEYRISDNYHFLSIPLEAHFQIKKSHSFWGGLETSYLLNRDGNSENADMAIVANDTFDPAFSYSSSSIPSVPRFDLGVSVGYEYNINQKIGLNLSYHHGNLLQQKNWHLDNRFFKLGANYNL